MRYIYCVHIDISLFRTPFYGPPPRGGRIIIDVQLYLKCVTYTGNMQTYEMLPNFKGNRGFLLGGADIAGIGDENIIITLDYP